MMNSAFKMMNSALKMMNSAAASEFSHPDVGIGLTIMAYRYEGLRMMDFKRLIFNLREEMQAGTGPYNKRTEWNTWARWVALAGGRVRGVGPKLQADYIEGHDDPRGRSPSPSGGGTGAGGGGEETQEEKWLNNNVWPLQVRFCTANDDVPLKDVDFPLKNVVFIIQLMNA